MTPISPPVKKQQSQVSKRATHSAPATCVNLPLAVAPGTAVAVSIMPFSSVVVAATPLTDFISVCVAATTSPPSTFSLMLTLANRSIVLPTLADPTPMVPF